MGPIGGHMWKTGVTMYRTFKGLPPIVTKPAPIRQAITTGAMQGITTYGGAMGYKYYNYHR
ncbi:hypothetical protein [Helicobacter apodemus]|uniref:Uncharacterized protein n=1 Tax=Helicobacter apodemus TaxID=135569 RepID=A0A2U8FE31_9HELI|nr:hypothetical protein [Helicobacter apodemus]AWI34087.1 hypothetical protein CDV25_04335 [Helicobacter apodemus]